jgi:hypothetical protein
MTQKIRYSAYLIKWQESDDATHWRAAIENAHTGEKIQFANKSKLLHFLWQTLYRGQSPDVIEAETNA